MKTLRNKTRKMFKKKKLKEPYKNRQTRGLFGVHS